LCLVMALVIRNIVIGQHLTAPAGWALLSCGIVSCGSYCPLPTASAGAGMAVIRAQGGPDFAGTHRLLP